MSRYTEKMLKTDVEKVNTTLAAAGSPLWFNVAPRNGCCAVDSYESATGARENCAFVESGTPRVCLAKVQQRVSRELSRLERGKQQAAIDAAYQAAGARGGRVRAILGPFISAGIPL